MGLRGVESFSFHPGAQHDSAIRKFVEVDRIAVEKGGEVTSSDSSPPAASQFYHIISRSLL